MILEDLHCNLSVSTTNFDTSLYPDWKSALLKAHELGFTSVDLTMFEGWLTINPSSLSETGLPLAHEIKEFLKEKSMSIPSINARFASDIASPDEAEWRKLFEDYKELLIFAENLAVNHITVQPGPIRDDERPDLTRTRLRKRLLKMSDAAEEAGITLALEGHYNSLLDDIRILEPFVRDLFPAVSLTFDNSHFIMQGLSTQDILPLLNLSTHCHLRDAKLNEMQAVMEEGLSDFPLILNTLKERGYKGQIALEYFDNFDKEHRELLKLKSHIEDMH